MKSKQIIIFSLILLTLPMIVGTTLAQTAVAGVTKGEIFDYNYNLAWNLNRPSRNTSSDLRTNKSNSINPT